MQVTKCSGYIPHIYWLLQNKFPPYECCCEAHDIAYEKGGTEVDRLRADIAFRKCLKRKYSTTWAWIEYVFVRMLGARYFNYTEF